jgi:hypothetical protein
MHAMTRTVLAGVGLGASCAVETPPPDTELLVAPEVVRHDDEDELPFKTVKLLIEHNATDEDTGFQFFADADPWRKLQVRNPAGAVVLTVAPQGRLKALGLTEMFFETNEPANAEVPIPDVLAHLPAGTYDFEGVTVDGEELDGEAVLSHRIPAAPVVTAPAGDRVRHDRDQRISWRPVTTDLDGRPVTVTHYQLIVNRLDQVPGPGFGAETLSVHVPASITAMTIPADFLLPATEYEWEVMAIAASGNQTFVTDFFTTRP